MQLTAEQLNIVNHHQGAAIVYAVAGAGKSTTMAHRVQHLVQHHNIKPPRILVCSFSKATVSDINKRIEQLGLPTLTIIGHQKSASYVAGESVRVIDRL